MQFFKATLYGSELSPTGITVDAHFSGQPLLISEHNLRIDSNRLYISVKHNELYLIWQDDFQGRWAIKPLIATIWL